MKIFKRILIGLVSLALVLIIGGVDYSFAETYPTRPIEIIVTAPAGGGADRNTRTIIKYAEKELGQKINVVNVVGGGNAIGYVRATKAKPDGYTLVCINSELTALEVQKLAPISRAHFQPIIGYACQYVPLITRADSPWKTYEEFVAKNKENPGKYNIGGTPQKSLYHLASVHFRKLAGIDFNWVPTGGSPKTMAAVAGGHVDTGIFWLSVADSYIKSGEMIGLVVMAPKRLKDYPQVPTLKEKGIDLTYLGYYGVGAPKGTPAEIIETLEKAFTKAANNPAFQEELTKKQKQELMLLNSKEFTKFLDEEYNKIQIPFGIIGIN